jgi:serine phosphatase RsbU (regulator of sigma subunit)
MNTELDAPRALVVDDDRVTRLLVRRALEGFGCAPVLEAENGRAAQEILGRHPEIDLVLTDILMPEVDGLELLRWGRENAPRPVWILLSGMDTFGTAVEAIRSGAFDFLAKPPRAEEIEVSVRNALEYRQLLDDRERLHAELEQANEQLVQKVRELEDKSELLRRDLQRAEVIQRALLPSEPPTMERFSVQALYRPGEHVGGDLYDMIRIDERHLAFYVADATGHGVSSAMLSVLFKQRLVFVEPGSGAPRSPAAALQAVNHSLGEAVVAPGLFLTAVYCLLDTRDGTVTLASAGHPPVLHVRANGETRLIRRTGPALGLTADATFTEERFQLESGDRLLLYTDGLLQSDTETERQRLQRLLSLHEATAQDVLTELLGDGALTPAAGQGSADADDVTILFLDVRAGSSSFDNGRSRGAAPGTAAAGPGPNPVLYYGETEDESFIALRGRATWTVGDALFETGCAIVEAGRRLVLHLADCEYLDSTCLGTVHELTGRGDVALQGVSPTVRALFEELDMKRVLDNIREPVPIPEMLPLSHARGDMHAGQLRVLRAHEALSALSPSNREKFQGVLDSVRRK